MDRMNRMIEALKARAEKAQNRKRLTPGNQKDSTREVFKKLGG